MSGLPVLEVDDLSVWLDAGAGPTPVVRDVSFRLTAGAAFGLVGESGAGKSTIAHAVLGLLPPSAVVEGSVRLAGKELVGLNERELRPVRGAGVSVILQESSTALNPVWPVGAQVAEAVAAHQALSRAAARDRAVELLDAAGIAHASRRADAYPHQLSGGLRQRVAIAIAMASDPKLIIADEPTTALDPTVERQVLDALASARARTGSALLLISHDLRVVEAAVDTVGVLYAGALVEVGPVGEVFRQPRMPYTRGLVQSRPRLDAPGAPPLAVLDGTPVSAARRPPGCPFAPRCPYVEAACHASEPALEPVGADHLAACRLVAAVGGRPWPAYAVVPPLSPAPRSGPPVLAGIGLVHHFPFPGRRRRVGQVVHAVCGVDVELHEGSTLGLVGESGCGKTTLARLLLGVERPTAGSVQFRGADVSQLDGTGRRAYRRDVQIVYQAAATALDPLLTVAAAVAEPLRLARRPRVERERRVAELLAQVGLDAASDRHRYPHELSAGQRQRVGIARALAMEPKVLLLDEPVSSLDASTQAGILALLLHLQKELNLAYLFVSHDLAVVQHMAEVIAVMHLGRFVEVLHRDNLLGGSEHPYTQALVTAATPGPLALDLLGEPPDPFDPPSGCRHREQCARYRDLNDDDRRRCEQEVPRLVQGPERSVGCHFPSS